MPIRRAMLVLCLILLVPACASIPGDAVQSTIADSGHTLEPPALRLPADVEPVLYELDLVIVPDREEFTGRVGIDLQVLNPVEVIWLNAHELTVLSASISWDGHAVEPALLDHTDDGFVGFHLPRAIEAGPARIEIAYRGTIHHDSAHSVYSEPEGDERYVYTFFEPVDARRAFPSFDEPGYKVPWRLTLTVPADDIALANTPIESESTTKDGMKRVRFAESKPLPTYLVAFIVGPFELVDVPPAGRNDVRIRIAVPRGRAGETAFAVESTPRVVDLLEEYFDMPYPFEKLDVAVVPRYWGTMEHPGLVAMGQPLTLIKPEEDGPRRRQLYVNILAHELAHYWFGDLVTMEWWDDLWLNESLATWLATKITDRYEPSWNYPLGDIWYRWRAMSGDALTSSRSLRQPVTTSDAILSSFDNDITYYKGAEVLGMLDGWLGEDLLRDGLRHYLRQFAWGNATSEDLLASLAAIAGDDAAAVAESFVEQAGVPVVSISCSDETGQVELRQRRFVADPRVEDATVWTIPVCVRYGHGEAVNEVCELTSGKSETIDIPGERCPSFVIGNRGHHGYYRTLYDDGLFDKLIADGISSATAAEQIGLVFDYRAFAWRGDVPVGQLLRLMTMASRNSQDETITSYLASILTLVSRDVARAEDFPALRELAEPLFLRRTRELGWGSPQDTVEARLLRSLLAPPAASLHDPELAQMAADLLPRYLKDRSAIDSDVSWAFLLSVANLGRERDYDLILEAARRTGDRTWRQALLSSLGSFQGEELTRRTFELILSDEFDRRDTLQMSYFMMRRLHPSAKRQVYEFIVNEWEGIRRDLRDEELHWFFRSLAMFCEPDLVDRAARELPALASEIEGGEYALAKGLEEATACARVRRLQNPHLKEYLAAGR